MRRLVKWSIVITISALFNFTTVAMGEEKAVAKQELQQLVDAINTVMFEHHYNIRELQSQGYQKVLQQMRALANEADSKQAFMSGFRKIWQNGPFSHVVLGNHQASAVQVAQHLDNMNVGGQGALLSWQQDVAVLTVNTMMGQDTITQINQHYQTIAQKQAKALIVDLRNNEGGAFAIRPLIAHLLDQPLQAGYFLSQKWSSAHQRQPSAAEVAKLTPWRGWSIMAFWQDVQEQALIKVQFEPAPISLNIPVYLLTSNKTASASELATEALQSAGRVTVIGEATAGQMLSQKPYDLPMGLQLYLPIADYYSLGSGRLEGNPIVPDIQVPAEQALKKALSLALQ